MTEPLDAVARQEIGEVLVRYASGIDGRDWALLRSCFTDDCDADYGPIGHWSSGDEITAWMRTTHEPLGHTLHRITNQAVNAIPGDVDRVAARCYVDALVLFPGDADGTRAVGFYDDELVLTPEGWKIARRRFTPVMLQMVSDGTVVDLGAALDL